jgi:hypothetical protein
LVTNPFEEFFELADVEIGQHVAVDNDRGDVLLAGEPFHLLVGSGVTAHINFLKGNVVLAQVVFGVDAPTAECTGVKFHLLHDLFL